MTDPSPSWQGRAIIDSPVPRLLHARPAIVLERIARGAGATNWYRCLDRAHLAALTAELCPGSIVSFYFDDRITSCRYTPQVREQVLQLMRSLRGIPGESGEIVVGHLDADMLHITTDYPSGPEDLDEFAQTLGADARIYLGRYPGRDNDGTNAVTLTLPDLDGITRGHPH
jgi:hypothetical protein